MPLTPEKSGRILAVGVCGPALKETVENTSNLAYLFTYLSHNRTRST